MEEKALSRLGFYCCHYFIKGSLLVSIEHHFSLLCFFKLLDMIIVKLFIDEMIAKSLIPVSLWKWHRWKIFQRFILSFQGLLNEIQSIIIYLVYSWIINPFSLQSAMEVITDVFLEAFPKHRRFSWIAGCQNGHKKRTELVA